VDWQGRAQKVAVRDELDIPIPAMAPSYRPSARRREAMDPATKRLTIFATVIGTALLGLVGVWAFTGHHHGGVPVIEADSRPVKVKPANPGGMQVEGANDAILSGEAAGKETVAPGPESPAPQALKAQEQAAETAQPGSVADASAPAAAAEAQPATPPDSPKLPALRPHVAARPAGSPPGSTASDGAASIRLIPGATPAGPLASTDARPRPAGRAPIPLTPPSAGAQPTVLAQVSATPPAPTQPAPALGDASAPGTASALPAPARTHGHRVLVQLAAVGSGEAALQEWQRLTKKYPDLFGGKTPNITKTDHDGKTFWRVRTGGFADKTQATVFCHELKEKGASCAVATF
jgi:SPOR domain